MIYLLMDFGSTSIKYCVYNNEHNDAISESDELLRGTIPFPKQIQCDNEFLYEVNLFEIENCIKKIFNDCKNYISLLNGIFISVQMHGYILTDLESNPLTQYISWQDKRVMQYNIDKTNYNDIDWISRGTIYKINLPLLSLQTYKYNEFKFFTLGSYITYFLTGNNISHITDCAATGFYNIKTCEKLYDDIILPKAVGNVQKAGKYLGIDVYSPVGDHQASFLGSNVEYDSYLLNIGTASQISTLSNESSNEYECRPYFNKERLCTVSGLMGGNIIREYAERNDIVDLLVYDYNNAIKKLPKKNSLNICGGGINYYKDIIISACDRLNIPYKINDGISALNGLKLLIGDVLNENRDDVK